MLFTHVIFSTYEFIKESLSIAKLAPSFLIPKNDVVLNKVLVKVKVNGLTKFKYIFLLKEFFFTSPQLKITLFNTVLLQFTLIVFFYKKVSNKISLLLKRKTNVSTY
jgi:hypothetical protein